jgi:hypothetical protein
LINKKTISFQIIMAQMSCHKSIGVRCKLNVTNV